MLLLSALQRKLSEHRAHSFAEATDLHETGADGEVKSGAYQKDDEYVVGKIGIDGFHDTKKCIHTVLLKRKNWSFAGSSKER